ncbi:MAG: Gfo/Idh/MocA family oxidoreductase [Actinomycetota bacterium]|nr:Gfo/Idh/MocA family oxidoreductase [Actinomycetota bacterium]
MTATQVAFIGAGFIASRHAQSLAALDGVQIVAVADPRINRTAAFATQTGARPYPCYQQMLDAEHLDAVYICVPPHVHGPPETAVLARELPLFVEKPLALDVPTAERICVQIRNCGVPSATGYHWRYLDTVDQARALLADRPPRLLLGYWLDRTPGSDWWIHQARSGGQLIEQATHLFDLARVLAGEISFVRADGARSPQVFDGDIHHVSNTALRFASGAVGAVVSTCLLRRGYRIGMELFCDGMVVQLTEQQLTVDDGTGRWTAQASLDPLVCEDRDFIDAVRGKTCRIRAPYPEALRTHRVAVAAATAAQEGSTIEIPVESGDA